MGIRIFNTLTKEKEEFFPLEDNKVGIYACGVTVYDECHIGHARSLYIFDVIRRYFEYRGFKVRFIRNITDIDDKIINKARERGRDAKELAQHYTDRYYEDLKALGLNRADVEPKATEYIPDMIEHIQGLIDKGFAYEAGGDVYFSVRKFKDYGRLSGQAIDQMQIGARIEPSEQKRDPLDFALWKKAKPDEPSWTSPWGQGRPGWHIECSVMSMKHLGQSFDIHAGGRDLIFPHHENEIAQAQALTDKPFAKYWIHHGLLTINGQKMAKSLGNFVTIKDFMDKYNTPDFLKLFFLSAHYSHPIDYTDEKIQEAKKAYERIDILMRKLDRIFGTRDVTKVITGGAGDIGKFRNKFIEYMDDDFNTPRGLSVLFEMIDRCNKLMDSNDELKNFKLSYAAEIIKEIADIFGLNFLKEKSGEISDTKITVAVALREQLRKEKRYQDADEVRKDLERKGIILEDTKEGTAWRRKM